MVRESGPVWSFLNRKAKKAFKAHPAPLDHVQKRVVADLKRDGMAMVHIDELFPGKNLLPFFQAYAQRLISTGKISDKKNFIADLWDPTESYITLKNPFIKLVLNNQVVSIINSYMGMCTRLLAFQGWVTTVVPKNSKATRSQRWHRDPEDKKTCKLFLYLNDIEDGVGPLHYIIGSHADGPYHRSYLTGPFDSRKANYFPEGMVERTIPQEKIKVATCKAGTIIFADTTGIHKGGYSTTKPRLSMNATFISDAAYVKRKHLYRFPDDWQDQLKTLSPQAQYAVEKR